MELLAAGLVLAHVVRRPAGAEFLAAGGQLPDQVLKPPVMRVAAGLGAKVGHQVVGRTLPVGKELACAGAEEHEPGDVGRPDRVDEQLGVQGVAEPVGGQDVPAAVAHIRRRISDRVQDALHARSDPLGRTATWAPRRRVGRPGQVEQVAPLGLVQLQGLSEGVQHALGDPAQVAPLQAGVVVDAHPGQQRDLLPAEARHAPVGAVDGQAGLLRSDPGPPGGQELTDLVAVVHDHRCYVPPSHGGRPSQYQDQQGLPDRTRLLFPWYPWLTR
jgi:hypothetical protein